MCADGVLVLAWELPTLLHVFPMTCDCRFAGLKKSHASHETPDHPVALRRGCAFDSTDLHFCTTASNGLSLGKRLPNLMPCTGTCRLQGSNIWQNHARPVPLEAHELLGFLWCWA